MGQPPTPGRTPGRRELLQKIIHRFFVIRRMQHSLAQLGEVLWKILGAEFHARLQFRAIKLVFMHCPHKLCRPIPCPAANQGESRQTH